MHQTGADLLDCVGSRVSKFWVHSDSLYAKFLGELEIQEAILVPEETEVGNFENRWRVLLKQHMEMLETLADLTGDHDNCERHAIDYVMSLLVANIREKLRNLRYVCETIAVIRAKYREAA
jgi:hypothetical protein